MYNISFSLGDPWGDGHAKFVDYHLVTTHSVEDITSAYKKYCKEVGFNFIEEVGADYDCANVIPKHITEELLKLGIIDDAYVVRYDPNKDYGNEYIKDWHKNYDGCYELEDAEEEFVTIFFDLITRLIPNFDWNYRILEEDSLEILEGAAYGFVYVP